MQELFALYWAATASALSEKKNRCVQHFLFLNPFSEYEVAQMHSKINYLNDWISSIWIMATLIISSFTIWIECFLTWYFLVRSKFCYIFPAWRCYAGFRVQCLVCYSYVPWNTHVVLVVVIHNTFGRSACSSVKDAPELLLQASKYVSLQMFGNVLEASKKNVQAQEQHCTNIFASDAN